jgi:quercetin dioxygenase-like cupin family protein
MTDVVALDDLDAEPHAQVFPGEEPRAVRLRLDAGEAVAEHTHPDRLVVVHVVDGEVDLHLDGEPTPASAGDVVRFDGRTSVAPEAQTDATALVVLAPRPA